MKPSKQMFLAASGVSRTVELQPNRVSFYKSEPKTLDDDDEHLDQEFNQTKDTIIQQDNACIKTPMKLDTTHLNPPTCVGQYQIVVSPILAKSEPIPNEIINGYSLSSTKSECVSPTPEELPQQKMVRSKSDQDQSSSIQNWNKIKNVLRGIQLFSNYEVQTISNPDDIAAHMTTMQSSPTSQSIENSPSKNKLKSEDLTASALLLDLKREAKQNALTEQFRLIDELKLRKQFFEAIENGSEEDLKYIEEYLKDDPKRYLLVEESPDRRMNKTDSLGQTPLYAAAKQGNIKVLQILKKYKANHRITSSLGRDKDVSETSLEVASRWGQLAAVEYLVKEFEWTPKELKDAKKASSNKAISKILSK